MSGTVSNKVLEAIAKFETDLARAKQQLDDLKNLPDESPKRHVLLEKIRLTVFGNRFELALHQISTPEHTKDLHRLQTDFTNLDSEIVTNVTLFGKVTPANDKTHSHSADNSQKIPIPKQHKKS